MKVIIPVAGIGTRLKPHTNTSPKALLPVAGKPILGHILDEVKRLIPEEVIFVIGFMGEKIKKYVKEKYSFPAVFVEQEELKGLGYAIYLASQKLKKNDKVLIILGDTIFKVDMRKLQKAGMNVIATKAVDDPKRFGIVELKQGKVGKLVEKPEKPTSNLAIVGIYYIEDTELLKSSLKEVMEKNIRTKDEYQLTDALQIMLDKKAIFSHYNIEGWYDCGKPETLLETNQYLLSKIKRVPKFPGSVIIPPVYISSQAKIKNSVIGPFVSVAEKAYIANSIIKNSIIGEGAGINNVILESSLVGNCALVQGTYKKLNVGESSEIGYF
jgi:glucose-1-phosphate thymidylyltransferase